MPLTLQITDTKTLTHKMFFFDANWKDSHTDQYIQDLFRKYFTKYVVGRETSKSGVLHYQANTYGSSSGYTNMIAQLKRKYNLSGRATKGKRRQYGAVSKIKDPSNALVYVLKENNYFQYGYDPAMLQKLQQEESYLPPPPPKDKMKKIVDSMIEYYERKGNKFSDYPVYGESHEQRLHIAKTTIETHYEQFDKLPTRNTVFNILYKANILTSVEYAKMVAGSYINLDRY